MTAAHARLAPSGSYQWAPDDGCRGAVAMQERYPEDADSEKAREGTAAHFHVTETLSGRDAPAGTETPAGVPVDMEMVDAGKSFIASIRRTLLLHPGCILRVEERVYMTSIHADCWGTPDVYLCDHANRTLHVWDYKYGHRFVDAFRNWQLILYAIGVLDSEGVPPDDRKHWSITLAIGQPRNYHPLGPIRTWEIGGPALMRYVEPLQRAAIEASVSNAPLRTGDHCRDCTARAWYDEVTGLVDVCPALQRSAALSIDVAYEQTPVTMSAAAVGLELRYLRDAEKRIKARADALEEVILAAMRGGHDVPLWKADYSSGRERWKYPSDQVAALGDMWGVDLRKPLECMTPAQARKEGVDDSVIKAFAEQPRGALKLVPVTDHNVAKAFN